MRRALRRAGYEVVIYDNLSTGCRRLAQGFELIEGDISDGPRLRLFNAAGADESGEIGEIHDPETHLVPLALAATNESGPELQICGADYTAPDGTCIRDYIHVNDLAEAHVRALQHLESGGDALALNLGTGCGHSVLEVIRAAERATGRPVRRAIGPRRPGDPPILVADPAMAEKVLGWTAKRNLGDTVASAWNWMQKNRTASPAARARHASLR
jgi:UDP-arabinose 4-epimerase